MALVTPSALLAPIPLTFMLSCLVKDVLDYALSLLSGAVDILLM